MSSRGVTPLVSRPAGQQTQRPAGRRPTRVGGELAGLSPSPSSPEPRIGAIPKDWTGPTGQNSVRDLRPGPLHVPPIVTAMLLDDRDAGYDADDELDYVTQAGRPIDRRLVDDQPNNVRDDGDSAPDPKVIEEPPGNDGSSDAGSIVNGSDDVESGSSGSEADPVAESASEATPPPPSIASYGARGPLPTARADLRTRTRDVVKEGGAGSGYLIQGGQKLLRPVVTGMQMTKLDQPLWKAWEKPDSDAITGKGDFLAGASNAVKAMGDVAQPFKLVEYAAIAKKNLDEVAEYEQAWNVIREWDRLDARARDATLPASRRQAAAAARDALDAGKALAKNVIASYDAAKKKVVALSGQVKGYAGFAKYGLGTGLAVKHCVDGINHAKQGFWTAFQASAKATAKGALGVTAGIVGVVFYPASAAYYYWQGKKDSGKLGKVRAMKDRIGDLAPKVRNDALFSDVVERIRRKTGKETFATKFKRWTNRFRAGIAAISTVGSAAALAKAAGFGVAVLAGAGAIAASWPFIVGVAGITALGTASYGIYKLARHSDSQSHKADQRQAFQASQDFAGSDQGPRAKAKFYADKCVRTVVHAMAADRSCFDSVQGHDLLDRFAARTLTAADLANIQTWAERENVRGNTSATLGMLLGRLVADGPDRSPGNGVAIAADLLHELGLDDARIRAVHNSAAAASRLPSTEAQAEALKGAMNLLAKELQLR